MHYINLKYEYIKDLRIVCDITFKKEHTLENLDDRSEDLHIWFISFINITEYIKDDYAIDYSDIYNYDLEDDDVNVEPSIKQCEFEFIDDE